VAVLELERVVKRYRRGGEQVHAVDGVSLTLQAGEMLALHGPSGSGKSTAMNILGCLDTPTSGVYRFRGVDVGALDRRQRALLRRHHLGFVFQGFNLLNRTSALENVELPMLYGGVPARERHARASEALARVGLAERAHHHSNQMSGGQQQRVAVARALVSRPAVVFADEPSGNLDSKASADVLQLLRRSVDEFGQTVIMVTHDPVAAAHADRLITLRDGKLVQDGRPGSADDVIELMKQLD